MAAEGTTVVGAVVSHWAEVGVTGSALALTYVTAFPYHVRKRVHARVRRVTVVVVTRTRHHIRAVAWQVTYILPGRVRTPWWRRSAVQIEDEES
jgi:hypothetical protein